MDNTVTYRICLNRVKSGVYEYGEMAAKLDAFLTVDHITMAEWEELTFMLVKREEPAQDEHAGEGAP